MIFFFFKKNIFFHFSFWKEGRKEEVFGSSYWLLHNIGIFNFFFDRTQACTLFFFFSFFNFFFFWLGY